MTTGATNYERVGVRLTITTERDVVGQRDVASPATADVGGARLRRAVGRNWFRNAFGARPGDRIGNRLLGNVLRTIAHTYRVLLGT